jgi:hypothetical protein
MTCQLPKHGIVVTSVPKCGTHLMQSLLLAVPGFTPGPNLMEGITPATRPEDRPSRHAALLGMARPSDVSIAHLHGTLLCRDALSALPHLRVFLLRDPRDFIVSYIDYVLDRAESHFHRSLLTAQPDDAARIRLMIDGFAGNDETPWLPGVRAYYELFWMWLTDPDTVVARYEELTEPSACADVLRRVLHPLGLPSASEDLDRAVEQGRRPERSRTYRIGRPGRWRERFTPDLCAYYAERTGDLNARLGYLDTP